jgi:hypothetical protein
MTLFSVNLSYGDVFLDLLDLCLKIRKYLFPFIAGYEDTLEKKFILNFVVISYLLI